VRAARLRGAAVVLACTATLAGCGGDDVTTSTDPVEVEVGETFSWNGFVVEDGWEINGIERSAGVDEVTTPEVKGTIKNELDEDRAAIFQMVFSADGDPVATLNCTAREMVAGQSQEFICPGLNATMPEDYDAVVVQEFTR
jgi:hypothetical protein